MNPDSWFWAGSTKSFQSNHIPNQVYQLADDLHNRGTCPRKGIQKYETPDKHITQFMLGTEKKYQKTTYGHVWSLKLATDARRVRH
eukprot:12905839-Ditylum_brightwellii.AAC.1